MAYASVSFDPDSVASTSDVASSALVAAAAASDTASAASVAAAKGSDASSKIAAKSATWDKASAASSAVIVAAAAASAASSSAELKYSIKTLSFDAQTGSFTSGNTVIGATSGATATIVYVTQSAGEGTLYLDNISGTFQDDEIIYEASYGSELVTNGDMELDANWSSYLTPTVNERSDEQAHGGTYSRKFTIDDLGEGITNGATITIDGDKFYRTSFWVYPVDTTTFYCAINMNGWVPDPEITGLTQGSWNNIIRYDKSFSGAAQADIYFANFTDLGTWYVDDVSVKQITNAALVDGTVQSASLAPAMEAKLENVSEDTTPQLGGDLEYNNKNLVFNTTLSSDETASGDIITVTFGEDVVFGKLCYPDPTDNEWKLALGTNAAVKHPALGVALETKGNGETGKLLLRGLIRSSTYFSAFALGDLLWLSDGTAGLWVNAAPSDFGDLIQIVGWVLTANYAFFDPDRMVYGVSSTGKRTASATDYNPSALTTDYIIAITNTDAARAVTISTEDEDSGTTSQPRIIIVKDESGGAAGHNITVSLESGGNIDGSASYVIDQNYQSITLYMDGTNAWIY